MSRLSAFSGSDQEVVPGVLRGYRAWVPYWLYTDVRKMEPRLRAMNFQMGWAQGRNVAICQNKVNRAIHEAGLPVPHASCGCGFYARHSSAFGFHLDLVVEGVIKAYGKVILGTEGFRAQYAEIEALSADYLGSLAEQSVEALEDYYQVPVYRSHANMVRDYPPISVKHLLPEPEPESSLSDWIAYWAEGPGSTAMMMTPTGPVKITEMRAFRKGSQ